MKRIMTATLLAALAAGSPHTARATGDYFF